MTKTELQDNLVFLSALKLLEQLTKKGLLTVDEAEKSRVELERKLLSTSFSLVLVMAIAEGLW